MRFYLTPIPARPLCLADDWLFSSTFTENDYTAYALNTIFERGTRVRRVSPSATVTFTAGDLGVVNWEFHQLENDTPIKFTTSGTLPTEVTSGQIYFIVNAKVNTFNIASTPRGPAILISGAGTGTHTGSASRHDIFESRFTSTRVDSAVTISSSSIRFNVSLYDDEYRSPVKDGMFLAYSSGKHIADDNTTDPLGTFKVTVGSTGSTEVEGYHLLNWPVTNSTYWPRISTTNKWAMFDHSSTSASVAYGSANVEIRPIGVFTGLYIHAQAATVRVQVLNGSFDTTYTANAATGRVKVLVETLDSISNPQIKVTFTNSSAQIIVYSCLPCKLHDYGHYAEYGASAELFDLTKKEIDTLGNTKLVEGPVMSSMDVSFWLPKASVYAFDELIKSNKSAPLIISASDQYTVLQLFGWVTSYRTIAEKPTHNKIVMRVEELS